MNIKVEAIIIITIRTLLRWIAIKPFFWFFKRYSKAGYLINIMASSAPVGQGSIVLLDFYEKNANFLPYAKDDFFLKLNSGFNDVAIVLQGPICHQDDFTLNTIRFYRGLFPNIKIYLSTWNTEKFDFSPDDEGFVLVRNPLPENPGPGNINCQILSTRYGLERAKLDGCRYAMKTRTDYRFLEWQIPEYYLSLLKTFPPHETGLHSRLIVPPAQRFIPFHGADYFMFGEIDDILAFWEAVPLRAKFLSPVIPKEISLLTLEDCMTPHWITEVYLYYNFARSIHHDIELSLNDYHQFLKDFLIVVDWNNWFWFKYNSVPFCNLNTVKAYASLGFSDWLIMIQQDKPDEMELSFDKIKQLKRMDRVSIKGAQG